MAFNDQKCFLMVTKCDITLLFVINRKKSLYNFLKACKLKNYSIIGEHKNEKIETIKL
jgi:hypothetical protein